MDATTFWSSNIKAQSIIMYYSVIPLINLLFKKKTCTPTIPYLRVLRGLRQKIGTYKITFTFSKELIWNQHPIGWHSTLITRKLTSYWMTEYTDYHNIIFEHNCHLLSSSPHVSISYPIHLSNLFRAFACLGLSGSILQTEFCLNSWYLLPKTP